MNSRIIKTSFLLLLLFLFSTNVQSIYAEQSSSSLKIWVSGVNKTNIGLYEKFEIEVDLDSAIYDNPYDPDQIDVQAIFTAPSGKSWKIFCFYDNYLNVNQWKARFAPNEIGNWSFHLTAVDATKNIGRSDTYQFTAIESNHHGWIHVSDDNPRYLEHDDGTSFYGVGMCYPWNVSYSGLSRLASFGANIFFYWNGTYDGTGNGGGRNLIESINSGLGRYDQPKCARLDELIEWSEALNIGMVLVIWPHDYFCDQVPGWPTGWQRNPYKNLCAAKDIYGNQSAWEYQTKQYRYIIARWGYSRALAGWQIICEITGTDGWEFGSHRVAEAWSQKVHDFFKAYDPFEHPTTGSQHGYVTCDWKKGYEIFDLPNREIYESQGWSYNPDNKLRSSLQIYTRVTQDLWNGFEKPIIIGETGYSSTFISPGTVEYTKLYHNALWATLANGMAATPFWWAYGSSQIVTGDVLTRMKIFGQFVADIDFARTPFTLSEVTAPNCDAYGLKSDSLAIGWIREIDDLNVSGKTFALGDMPDGAYLVKWFDTWTGVTIDSQIAVCFDEAIVGTIPELPTGQSDIAFTITVTEKGVQPAMLELFATSTVLFNDAKDTSTITCLIKDSQGRFCTHADNQILFELDGAGRFIGSNPVTARNGLASIQFLPDANTDIARIIATSPGLIPDTITIQIKNNFTIDDFEQYTSQTHFQSYWDIYSGTQTTIALDNAVKKTGAQGMRMDYTIGVPCYAGAFRKIMMDWRRFSALRLWIKPDGSNRTLAIMFKELGGKVWQFDFILSDSTGTVLEIPFTDFKLYYGSEGMNLTAITQIILYVTKGAGENGNGSLYFDNFEVLISPSTNLGSPSMSAKPTEFILFQNYPNPFNSTTAISYQLPANSVVELSIFDLLGKKIETLVQHRQDAGFHIRYFDASELASGLYFYQLKTGNITRTKKMLLIN